MFVQSTKFGFFLGKKMSHKAAANISRILATLILVSTLLNWKEAFFFPVKGLVVDPLTTQNLMMFGINFPGFVSCLVGSVLLLFGKRWGYYCLYASLLLSLGPGISFIPCVVPCIRAETESPVLLMTALFVTNLLVTCGLIWTHRVLRRKETQTQN